MKRKAPAATLLAADTRELQHLLGAEQQEYRRLLRLAWRQNAYMKRQDVARLAENVQEWQKYLPAAHSQRRERQKYVAQLAASLGLIEQVDSLTRLLDHVSAEHWEQLQKALRELLATTTQLARQNELNRQLAAFCCDLASEEAAIFKSCVLDDPAGCYGEDAQKSTAGPGGVLERQA